MPNNIVSYVVMAHHSRLAGAARVLGQLDRTCEVVVDQESRGPWWTAKRAWQLTPSDCEWRCLLQDDIDLAPGFSEQLEQLVSNPLLSGRPLALYNGLPDEPLPNKHWIERIDGVQGPCIAMARADVFDMLAWCERNVQETDAMRSADIRPSLWLEAMDRGSLCPSPSWVQHRGWEESLLGSRSSVRAPRTAPTFTGEPLHLVDWTRGLAPYAARVAGLYHGASLRVRNRCWRVGATETDWILERRQQRRQPV